MFKNAFAGIAGVILLVLGFMFSIVLLAVIAGVGLVAWAYLMWKTRHARRAMREQAQAGGTDQGGHSGQVFDGEAVVVEEYHVKVTKTLPQDQHPSNQ